VTRIIHPIALLHAMSCIRSARGLTRVRCPRGVRACGGDARRRCI